MLTICDVVSVQSRERSKNYLRGQPGVRILCYGPPHIPLNCWLCGIEWNTIVVMHENEHCECLMHARYILLRSAVGKTHDLRSDLWCTIPLRILLDHFGITFGFHTIKSALARHSLVVRLYSEIDHIHLSSVSAIIYPRWTATYFLAVLYLGKPGSYDAKIAKIFILSTLWPVILIIVILA